jgi:hypothetical protein
MSVDLSMDMIKTSPKHIKSLRMISHFETSTDFLYVISFNFKNGFLKQTLIKSFT